MHAPTLLTKAMCSEIRDQALLSCAGDTSLLLCVHELVELIADNMNAVLVKTVPQSSRCEKIVLTCFVVFLCFFRNVALGTLVVVG